MSREAVLWVSVYVGCGEAAIPEVEAVGVGLRSVMEGQDVWLKLWLPSLDRNNGESASAKCWDQGAREIRVVSIDVRGQSWRKLLFIISVRQTRSDSSRRDARSHASIRHQDRLLGCFLQKCSLDLIHVHKTQHARFNAIYAAPGSACDASLETNNRCVVKKC